MDYNLYRSRRMPISNNIWAVKLTEAVGNTNKGAQPPITYLRRLRPINPPTTNTTKTDTKAKIIQKAIRKLNTPCKLLIAIIQGMTADGYDEERLKSTKLS